jgi:hypothetical protein
MPDIISVTRKKVKSLLKEIYGKNYVRIVHQVDSDFVIMRGSAAVHVSFKSMSKIDCIITARSYVVQGAKITPKLLSLLMQWNASNLIGAFGLLFDDTITFSHSIAGAHIDKNELRTTISTVAFVADEMDDKIRKIAGGFRAVDANAAIMRDVPAVDPGVKAVAKKTPAKQPAAKILPVMKAVAKKSAAKKTPVKKVAPKKAPSKKRP